MGAVLSRMLDEQDAVLLGRVTFTEWAGYWPTATDEPFASWINLTPKYVAFTTLDSVDQWENSTVIKGSVADFLTELREQDGGTIGTAGSPSLVRSLIEQGLLDELVLTISPSSRAAVAGGCSPRTPPRSRSSWWRPSRPARAPDGDLPPDPVAEVDGPTLAFEDPGPHGRGHRSHSARGVASSAAACRRPPRASIVVRIWRTYSVHPSQSTR
jgi:dihydrofolate reductase